MRKGINRRKLAEDATPDLKGKTVLIVGNRFYSEYYKLALQEAGATVEHTNEMIGDFLLPDAVPAVAGEVAALDKKPDAVMIFHPGMGCTEQPSFSAEPAILLSAEMKKHGIPTLILDTGSIRSMGLAEDEIMKRAGASYYSSLTYTPFETLPLVAQTIVNKEKSKVVSAL
jgi:hypothetical protein